MAIDSTSPTDHEKRSEETYEYISAPTISTQHSLSRAVYERRAEYTRPHTIKVKVGTWNVAACKDVEKDIGGWFVEGKGIDKKLVGLEIFNGSEGDQLQDGIESAKDQEERRKKKRSTLPIHDDGTLLGRELVDLYVLGLQEVVDLTSLNHYLTRVYTDPSTSLKWKAAMVAALPAGYQLVSEQQLSGLLLLIYASPHLAPTVGSISSVNVGTGALGVIGNKGAVITRIVLGETTRLVFVNCHLASGTGRAHLERRCWDVTQILTRTQFEPIIRAGVLDDNHEGIGKEDFAFWLGDLNFRLEGLPGDDIRRLLMLHTRGEYGSGGKTKQKMDEELAENDEPIVVHHVDSDDDSTLSSPPHTSHSMANSSDDTLWSLPDPEDFVQDPHSDPTSLQATIDSLLPHDELRYAQRKRMAFHDGWREGPIAFLPTYKYDVGSVGLFDSSEKKRAPSWCDRILFRSRRDKLEYDGKLQDEELARLKDQEMKARGIDKAGEDDEVLFDYDPESDGADVDPNDDYDGNEHSTVDSQAVIADEGYVDALHLEVYTSHQRVLSSDHKPLDAVFTLHYDAVVPELRSKVQQEVARELDRVENEGRPGITIVVDHSQEVDDVSLPQPPSRDVASTGEVPPLEGVEGVDFGQVRYLKRKPRSLTIANTGRVPATFSFVKRPTSLDGNDSVGPEWLRVVFDPPGGNDDDCDQRGENPDHEFALLPGDAINVTLEIYVESLVHVRALNAGSMQLDDVLVLRVVDGRDHFIPLRGAWLQSCFGRSVDELIRVPEGGVRALLPRRHAPRSAPVNRGQEVCWSAPRELFKLTEAMELLTERAVADREMVESASFPINSTGWPFDQNSWITNDKKLREERRIYLLEALDSDKNLIEAFPPEMNAVEKLEIVAEVLLLFLDSVEDGIITAQLWDKLDQGLGSQKHTLNAEEERTWILDVLSSAPNHNISFVFLTSMLSKILTELSPLPRPGSAQGISSAKSSMDHRRSLSFRGRSPPVGQDPMISRHKATARRWSEIFARAVIRASPVLRERDRRAAEDRKRQVIEVFLQGDTENGLG